MLQVAFGTVSSLQNPDDFAWELCSWAVVTSLMTYHVSNKVDENAEHIGRVCRVTVRRKPQEAVFILSEYCVTVGETLPSRYV